jgi:hypothetical protein
VMVSRRVRKMMNGQCVSGMMLPMSVSMPVFVW